MLQLQVKKAFLDWTSDETTSFVCSNMLTIAILSENVQYTMQMKEQKERKGKEEKSCRGNIKMRQRMNESK